jgi:hypothetical protein
MINRDMFQIRLYQQGYSGTAHPQTSASNIVAPHGPKWGRESTVSIRNVFSSVDQNMTGASEYLGLHTV